MKKLIIFVFACLFMASVYGQVNQLKNAPDYQIFEGNVESLTPEILVSNKVLSKEDGISEKFEIQSFQKSTENNDINVTVEIKKYLSNPLNENPMAGFLKIQRTLDNRTSLIAAAFTELEGDADDDMIKADKNRSYCQINIDPEEGSDFRMKRGGEKMKKKEFGINLDAMFNYVNSLLKGSFHDAESKWETPKEYRHFYYAAAGNMYIKVEVYAHKTAPDAAPNARSIANEILKKLPRSQIVDIPTSLEVYPKLAPLAKANDHGLIPASSLLPAKIVYKVGKPNVQVNYSLLVTSPGELRAENKSGKSISVNTDSNGDAVAWYYYTDQKSVNASVETQIVVEADGKSHKAYVSVGLGLAFDQLSEVPEQVYEYAAEKPYAFALSVKSRFFPNLNLAQYVYEAHESQVWGTKRLGVQLETVWVNKPDGARSDESYLGSTNIQAVSAGGRTNVLIANVHPMQYYTKNAYPGVLLKSQGTHIYKVIGQIAVLDGSNPDKPMISEMNEKMANTEVLIPLSVEYPERWYKSIACSLSSVDNDQWWFWLEAAKLIPTYGLIADAPTAASQFLCGMLNGDYEKSILDLASWLGGQYIDNLMEADIFNKLTKQKQDAVLAAKTAYFGTDMYKKNTELEQLRANQKALMK